MTIQYAATLYDWDGNLVSWFDGTIFQDFKYSKVYNGVGSVAITFAYREDYEVLFKLDYFLEILRENPSTGRLECDETFQIRYFQHLEEEGTEYWIVGGFSLNHLLQRRVVHPADDPLNAGGFSTKAGTADDVILAYVDEQAGPSSSAQRRIPGLTLGVSYGTGNRVGQRLRYENLLEAIQKLAIKGEVDFRIRRLSGASLIFEVGKLYPNLTKSRNYPQYPFIYLTPKRGNLSSPSLVEDRKKEKTFCYIEGQGQGTAKIVFGIASGKTGDSPFNRIEFQEDGRTSEKGDSLGLLTDGYAALDKAKAEVEFTFGDLGSLPGAAYKLDWDIGTQLTVNWKNTDFDLRIIGIELTINNNRETITTEVEVLTSYAYG